MVFMDYASARISKFILGLGAVAGNPLGVPTCIDAGLLEVIREWASRARRVHTGRILVRSSCGMSTRGPNGPGTSSSVCRVFSAGKKIAAWCRGCTCCSLRETSCVGIILANSDHLGHDAKKMAGWLGIFDWSSSYDPYSTRIRSQSV